MLEDKRSKRRASLGVCLAVLIGWASTAFAQVPQTGAGLSSAAGAPFTSLPATNLAAVFSLRKAVSGYAGKAVNVRRSSDNTTLDIGFAGPAGNDFDSVAAQTFAGSSTLYVTKWYDQSGALQCSAATCDASQVNSPPQQTQPTLSFGLTGHNPGVCFGGQYNNAFFSLLVAGGILGLTGDQTIGAVVDSYSSLLGQVIQDYDTGTALGWAFGVGNAAGTTRSATYWSSTKAAFINETTNLFAKQAERISITRTTGSVQFYVNGVASGSAVAGGGNSAATTQHLTLGAAATSGGSNFNGCMHEVYAYSAALSSPNLALLDASESNYFPQANSTTNTGTASLAFSGSVPATGQTITIGSHLTFERTQPWTAFAAFRCIGVPTVAGMIFTNVTSATPFPGYELWLNANGFLNVRIINSITLPDYVGKFGSINMCDGKPHMAAATYDGSSTAAGVLLYEDGVLDPSMTVESDTLNASIISGTQTFMVGNQNGHLDFYFRGIIDFFSLDNVVRNAAYIAAVTALALPANNGANTSLYLPFNEDAGTTTADASANGFNGTLSSASQWYPQ